VTTDHAMESDFVSNGYAIVRDLVSADDITTINRIVLEIGRGQHPCKGLKRVGPEVSDHEALMQVTAVHHPHFSIPPLMDMIHHAGIVEILSKIVGAHLPPDWWDGGVKCMQSMLFCKPPGALGQAWHQDEAFIPTRDRSLCGAWIALDDATVENGCLWALPGGHRSGILHRTQKHDQPEEWDDTVGIADLDTSGAVALEVEKGSVIFFNGYLPHMSLRNRSSHFRRAFVAHYMTMRSLLPWNLEADEIAGWRSASADQRAVVPVVGDDPYAAKGYWIPHDAMHLRGYEN
jgi:phytanoyl-CoA hydroxylase